MAKPTESCYMRRQRRTRTRSSERRNLIAATPHRVRARFSHQRRPANGQESDRSTRQGATPSMQMTCHPGRRGRNRPLVLSARAGHRDNAPKSSRVACRPTSLLILPVSAILLASGYKPREWRFVRPNRPFHIFRCFAQSGVAAIGRTACSRIGSRQRLAVLRHVRIW